MIMLKKDKGTLPKGKKSENILFYMLPQRDGLLPLL